MAIEKKTINSLIIIVNLESVRQSSAINFKLVIVTQRGTRGEHIYYQ